MFYRLITFLLITVLASCVENEGVSPGDRQRGGRPSESPPIRTSELDSVSVRAHKAKRESISTHILSTTTLEAIRKVTIYAKLNAIVEQLYVEEGSNVHAGQRLLLLEDREIRNEYSQAQIALDQSELAVRQAEVKSQQSAVNYDRAQSLFDQKLVSQQEFDQTMLTNQTDELAFEAGREQYKAAQARLEAAKIQLDYTEIHSSINGVVTERLIHVGDRVNVNQAVFSIEDFSVLWARIFIPEKELSQIRVGQTARIQTEAIPGQYFNAVVKMINPVVDVASGTIKVTLEVRGRADLLRPGMFGIVFIATETRPDVIVIPKKAILRERDDNRVFVIQSDRTVTKREILLGFTEEDRVEILSGVKEGEVIVTVGYEGLNEGYPVNIVAWEDSVDETESSQATIALSEKGANLQKIPRDGNIDRSEGASRQVREDRRLDGSDSIGRERVQRMRARLMDNPEVRQEYESRLQQDPALATDLGKQTAFFREMMRKIRGRR